MKPWLPFLRAALLLATVAPSPAIAADLVPHEARYDLSLLELRSADKGSASGLFLVRIERTCDGWTHASELQVKLETESGGSSVLQSRSTFRETIAEDGAAGTLDFRQQQMLNNSPISDVRGEATRGPEGGTVRYSKPARRQAKLPPGVEFPTSGWIESLRRLYDGERLVRQTIFDGGEEGALLAVDLIAGTPEPPDGPVRGDAGLLSGEMLRTVTAFYPLDEPDSEPMTSYVSDLYDNGVTVRLSIDVGLALVDAELRAIRRLPEPEC